MSDGSLESLSLKNNYFFLIYFFLLINFYIVKSLKDVKKIIILFIINIIIHNKLKFFHYRIFIFYLLSLAKSPNIFVTSIRIRARHLPRSFSIRNIELRLSRDYAS